MKDKIPTDLKGAYMAAKIAGTPIDPDLESHVQANSGSTPFWRGDERFTGRFQNYGDRGGIPGLPRARVFRKHQDRDNNRGRIGGNKREM